MGGWSSRAGEDIRRLHLHRKAEVLARLFGDGRDRGDGRSGVAQDDALDVLCPNGGEAGDGPRSDGCAGAGRQGSTGDALWVAAWWCLTS